MGWLAVGKPLTPPFHPVAVPRVRISQLVFLGELSIGKPYVMRKGITLSLHSACPCRTMPRLVHEHARRLQRNELLCLYPWKQDNRLVPLHIANSSSETVQQSIW